MTYELNNSYKMPLN